MAIIFPPSPSIGTIYPSDPGVSGSTQYEWDGVKWNAVLSTVSLGTQNQGAYNSYQWPATDGTADQQLTTDGAGNLTWEVPASPSLQILSLLEPFNGSRVSFTLIKLGSSPAVPFVPNPPENLVVFLGGVPQIPAAAYSMSLANPDTIIFTEPPLAGTTFYAISSIVP